MEALDLIIKLVEATVVNVDDSEGETLRDVDVQGDLAVFAALRDGNVGTDAGFESAESDRDRSMLVIENVER